MSRVWAVAPAAALFIACNGEFHFDEGADASTGAGCSSDKDCKLSTLHCDVSSAQCVACIDDTQCTELGRPRCDAALHACVECGSNQDCGSNGTCEPSTRKCVPK